MKKLLMSLATILLASISVEAQTSETVLEVLKSDGQILAISLAEEPRTTYSDGNLIITSASSTVTLPLENVRRYTYAIIDDITIGLDDLKVMRADFSKDGESLTLTGIKPQTSIYLYNAAGQLLRTINGGAQTKVVVSVSHLPMGVYIVKANDVNYKITKR